MNAIRPCSPVVRTLTLAVMILACQLGRQVSLCGAESEVLYWFSDQWQADAFAGAEPATADPQPIPALSDDTSVVNASYNHQANISSRRFPGSSAQVGYDNGFVIAGPQRADSPSDYGPFLLRMNGWGQLRHTNLESRGTNPDLNQFQLKRARLVFSGHSFTPEFKYFVQLEGRSSSGDGIRLLDYFLAYDVGHHALQLDDDVLQFKTGLYKVPFTMARYLSGREFEFADRSMASMFFDVNRSLACGLYGEYNDYSLPWNWEASIFNGLVTGGAETGSSGALDDNFAYSGRIACYPVGEWGPGQLADFQYHETLAVRVGSAFARSNIERSGATEFQILRVADSGATLASLLPAQVSQYQVNLYAIDASCKWRGWSTTLEYYFRQVDDFDSPLVADLFDHGFWYQIGKFVIPRKLELLARWSRVVGDSGTLGAVAQSADEIAGGAVWYFRDQNAKLTFDFTHLNGAPINSSALDISPGDLGWLFRTQMQFAF